MPNIFDYLKWRDIPIENVEFNEIDNLILSRVSYFPFDDILKENEKITLREAYDRFNKLKKKGHFLQKEDKQLFLLLAKSIRFGEIFISNYINKIDQLEEKQFSAITFFLPDDTIYVAFRGTDDTLIGWKEDLNMSFTEFIPAQVDAVKYLEDVARKNTNKLVVGGHSKGGNLAIYASVFCKESIKNRIIKVYNNDGPGFTKNIVDNIKYEKMSKKMHTYIPQTSIIGRLLNHKEETTIIKSTQLGIMQHDIYSWQLLGDKFIRVKITDSTSEFIDKTISNWLEEVDNEQKEKFFDTLYDILVATNVKTLSEIGNNWFNSAKAMVKSYKNLNQESKQMLNKTLNMLLKIGTYNIFN